MNQHEIQKLHPGVMSCPVVNLPKYFPEIIPIVNECGVDPEEYVVDAKVHMLMPNQWPCIPNWHRDFVPRDNDGVLIEDPSLINTDNKMFLWLSGPPFTEFADRLGRTWFVESKTWHEFTQLDYHRGHMSESFQWRLFIRLAPRAIVPRVFNGDDCLRRHSQVYLDVNNFLW